MNGIDNGHKPKVALMQDFQAMNEQKKFYTYILLFQSEFLYFQSIDKSKSIMPISHIPFLVILDA